MNISSRQFGTRPVPMPTSMPRQSGGVMGTRPAPMPSTIGSFGSGSSNTRPMPSKIGGLGGSNVSPTKPVKMPTKIFGR
jgi:hypothetical protein